MIPPNRLLVDSEKARARALRGLRIYFAYRRWPRATMAAIVSASGAAGFVASYAMLHAGIANMAVRYPLAVLAAWAFFLLLVRLWAEAERRLFTPDEELERLLPLRDPADEPKPKQRGTDVGEWMDAIDIVDAIDPFDWEDPKGCLFWLAIAVLIVLFGAAASSVWCAIVGAPALIAEVFLDAALAAALFKRMRGIDERWWLGGAIRQTIGPVLLTAVFLALLGLVTTHLVPTADSIGDLWPHYYPPPIERG